MNHLNCLKKETFALFHLVVLMSILLLVNVIFALYEHFVAHYCALSYNHYIEYLKKNGVKSWVDICLLSMR